MFVIFPLGHDQEVYSQPWLTYGLIAACCLVFVWQSSAQDHALSELDAQLFGVARYLDEVPEARISPSVADQLPAQLRGPAFELTAATDDDPDVDFELEDQLLAAGDALRRVPTLRLGYVPADGGVGRMVTSMFAHGGWMHLIGNMVFLLLTGAVIECFWRPAAFVGLYLLAGVAGALAHRLVDPTSAVPLVGASGAIAGLMAAFLLGHARTRIRLGYFVWFFFAIRAGAFVVPALVVIPLWAAQQVFYLWLEPTDGVAYAAHVGGFLAGVAATFGARHLRWIATDAGRA
ncbi:MAG: rhomboid family intramembrane serine protease [Myxococcales bacterium]|nr:rhomboid family intramembrane serine protease [Myxococcales bacterium]MCB9540176.1 rhomboid family intramembrane serine protease [Myxococcales bacterium]